MARFRAADGLNTPAPARLMSADSMMLQALVYLAAGVVSVPIAKRLGLGSVLGYLIAGALVGPFVLNLVGEPGDVMRFAEFGVVILLFLIGLEVRPALLWRMRTVIFGVGLGQVVVTAALVAAAALALGQDWRVALAVGAVLAMSSTAIVLQNLEEKGLRQGPVGETTFGVLLFQDLAVIPLFALLPLLAVAGSGGHSEGGGHGGELLAGLPGWAQPLAVIAAVIAVVVAGRYLTLPLFRFIAQARLREIFTATALLIVVGVAVLMELVGLSPALGAFLAGVVLAESEFRRELETDIEPFRGLLLGLFFITVGAGVDFGLVTAQPLLLIGLVIGLMALKAAAMFAVARTFRVATRDAATTAVALAQGGEFAFVLLTFTVGAGVMGAELARLLTAVVALSMALTPLAFGVYEKLVLARMAARPEPEHIPFDEGDPDVIVAGFGRFGQIAARLLLANDFKVVVLDSSIEQIDTIRKFGWRVHYGDASRIDLLRTAGAEKARLLLVAIDDKDKAIEMVQAASEAFPNLTVMARAYDLIKAGVDDVERELFEGSLAYARRALVKLGMHERRALRSATLFREHDRKLFNQLAPLAGEEERFIAATKDARQTMEELLRTEMSKLDEAGEEREPFREEAPKLASPEDERIR